MALIKKLVRQENVAGKKVPFKVFHGVSTGLMIFQLILQLMEKFVLLIENLELNADIKELIRLNVNQEDAVGKLMIMNLLFLGATMVW